MRLDQFSTLPNQSSLKTRQESRPIYKGHSHFAERALSRRAFLGMTAAASGFAFAGLAAPPLAHAAVESHLPKPIPGGLQLLGPSGPLFHVFLPGPGTEPITITDFHGFVGLANVGGRGTRKESGGQPRHLFFDADNRFMSGVFVGRDGKIHHGTFGFV
jgi:hypothetical protein